MNQLDSKPPTLATAAKQVVDQLVTRHRDRNQPPTHTMRLDALARSLTVCTLSHGSRDEASLATCFRSILDRYGVRVRPPKRPGKFSRGRTCTFHGTWCWNRITDRNKSGICTECWNEQPSEIIQANRQDRAD